MDRLGADPFEFLHPESEIRFDTFRQRDHRIGRPDLTIGRFQLLEKHVAVDGGSSSTTDGILKSVVTRNNGQATRGRVLADQLFDHVIGFLTRLREQHGHCLVPETGGQIGRRIDRIEDDGTPLPFFQ